VSDLSSRAEQVKLARTLRVAPSELDFLAGAPAADLATLRERAAGAIFTAHRSHFERAVAIGRRLPAGLNATLAQRALGPTLAAHTAALLEPGLAKEMIKRLPAPFLAEVAVHADPIRIAHLIGHVPPAKTRQISEELARRQEWVVMGAFVSHLKPAALEAAIEPLGPEALLRTGFVIEDKENVVDKVVRLLSQERLIEYGRTAIELDLLPEALDLASHLTRRSVKRLSQALASLGDEELERFASRVKGDPVLLETKAVAELREVGSLRVQAALEPA
jgi:hypothetical protein